MNRAYPDAWASVACDADGALTTQREIDVGAVEVGVSWAVDLRNLDWYSRSWKN